MKIFLCRPQGTYSPNSLKEWSMSKARGIDVLLQYYFRKLDRLGYKWIDIGCPLMVLFMAWSTLVPFFLFIMGRLPGVGEYNNTLQIGWSLISSQLVFIVPVLFAASFFSNDIELSKKLGLTKWNFSFLSLAIAWESILVVPLIMIGAAVYLFFSYIGYNFSSPILDLLSKSNRYGIALIFISSILFAPIIEEIAFRRVLFIFMSKFLGVGYSVIVTSLIFALIHGGIIQILPLFILGIILQYLYLKHATLFPSILLHATHNLVTMSVYLFSRLLS